MKRTTFFISFILLVIVESISAQTATLSGFVTDSTNGESLIGANIYFQDLPIGISSNEHGYFLLQAVPAGKHVLIVNYLGYHPLRRQFDFRPGEKKILNIMLSPQAVPGEEVLVSAERLTSEREIQLSQVELSTRTIRSAPQLGEADLFRTIQALPGVVSESDFSTGLVVRGGNTDQNLIMLDGITVYNPSHMGGLFSNFLLDAIKDARFIKGGFPAEYGGRMSSVLNIISKAGNSKHIAGSAGVSMLSSRFSFEAPLQNGALLLAGRRTYFDKALQLIGKEFPYYFYDFQGSLFQDFSANDRLTLSGYFGNDVLDWNKLSFDLSWGNRTFAANWRHIFSPRLFSNFMAANSHFKTNVQLGGDQGVDSKNTVNDFTLKGDLNYFLSQSNIMKFGFEFKNLEFQYRDIYNENTLFRLRQTPVEMGFYLQDDWKINSRWIVKPGVRVSYFSRIRRNFYIEPRLAVKFRLRDGEYLNYSTGLYRQFIFTVQDEYNPTLVNSWFAIDKTVPPGRSIHNIFGYERALWGTTRLQIEVYYKTLDNMLTYRERRSSVDEKIGDDVRAIELFEPSNGWSSGLEFFLHKKYGRLAGWVGYTLNWAKKTMGGQTYFASFDRRHNLNIMASYGLGRHWRLAVRFNYGSGFPYTRVVGSYEERDGQQVRRRMIYGGRNLFRYPAYHRLDVSVTKNFKWLGAGWQFDLQLVNAYNHKNVFLYEWDFDENPAERTEIPMLPIIPTVGISASF